MDDMARILGLPDFQNERNFRGGPTFLADMVQKMTHNMQDLQEDNRELERVIEQLRQDGQNQAYAGKMISEGEQGRLQGLVRETEKRFREVEEENRRLRSELEKQDGYRSAF